jgi:hypothetical protein
VGIWIRSQDKKILTNTLQVFVSATGTVRALISGSDVSDTIGIYNPERALQVLGEIQEYVNDFEKQKLYATANLMDMATYYKTYNSVYQMPAE